MPNNRQRFENRHYNMISRIITSKRNNSESVTHLRASQNLHDTDCILFPLEKQKIELQ